MKKIAITQRVVENDSYFEIRESLDINYAKMIKKCKYLPIVLPYEVDFKKYFKNIKIDGVVLSGGNDIYECNKNSLSKKRDKFELKLLKYCIKNNIPVLGICRGMQIIAKYFGSDFKAIENHVAIKHKLNITKSSKYYRKLKKIDKVNSYHNFAINNLAKDLIVSATSTDGVIKAIEHKKYKIFAQMWHSEREKPFKKNELKLIKAVL